MEERILIVDDEKEIADLVALYLTQEGFLVSVFYRGKDALEHLQREHVDLGIFDVMMPELDGFELCAEVRKQYHFPIIMLTAKGEESHKVTGLTMGADDYITKPFRHLELVARVKAQLRRVKKYNLLQEEPASVFSVGGLELDQATHRCFLDGEEVILTPTEFSILSVLCRHYGKVVSAEALFAEVWGEKYFTGNNTVMVHIRHLRTKLGDVGEKPRYIKTVWGVGYKIEK